jgi:hypothetical protein
MKRKLGATAALALLSTASSAWAISGPWHPVASAGDTTTPSTQAALSKENIANVRQLGLRVSAAGSPHIHGSLQCTRGGRVDFKGFDYVVTSGTIRPLETVHLGGPAKCNFSAFATISGTPVPLTMVAYKR